MCKDIHHTWFLSEGHYINLCGGVNASPLKLMLKLSPHSGDVRDLTEKSYISHFFGIKNQGQFLHKPCQ